MTADGSKLSVFLGERDRSEGRFVADRVVAELDRAGVRAAILMRGAEGFGGRHGLRTDRLLTLSEDLPVVAIGVGAPEPVAAAADRIAALPFSGPLVAEPVLIAGARGDVLPASGRAKLSAYVGRGRRVDGRPAHEWLVCRLREAGADGAVVLLGVDGVLGGTRRRAGFFARNADVPALVVAVGDPAPLAGALAELSALPGDPVVTLERANVCKRGGGEFRPPPAGGTGRRRLSLFAREQDHAGGRPVHVEAVRRLRAAGAAGATALRGIWGFDGGREPGGDSLRSLVRRVPTLTVVVDEADRCDRWLSILAGLTPEHGLLVSEDLPAPRAGGPRHSSPAGTS